VTDPTSTPKRVGSPSSALSFGEERTSTGGPPTQFPLQQFSNYKKEDDQLLRYYQFAFGIFDKLGKWVGRRSHRLNR